MAGDNPSDNARTRVVDSGAPLALAVGMLLGRYRIDGVLGQGAFGITYRATDTALNRAVAIKEYLPSDVAIRIDGSTVIPRSRTDASDYDWGLKRFLDEAKTLAQHEAVPNVVRVYDFVEANGTAYMVMALVEGDNLSAILRQRGTLNEQELRGIVLPLLDGLEQLHEAGLIHRDIKPANIILRGGRSPTLIDFGAAREGLGRKSRSVTSILTPGYAPFEQYGSAGDQGPWTDIYALAATIYHGVAGKAPPDSVDRIRRDPLVPAVQAGAGRYSEQFLAAIDAGLKVDERERPQNAAQWRELFGGAPVSTITPTTILPATVAPTAPPPVSVPYSQPVSQPAPSLRPSVGTPPPPSVLSAPPAARAGSRGKMMIAAGVAVVLIGGGVAVALTMGGSPETIAAKPDLAALQMAEAEKQRTAELEKKLAQEAESRKKLEAQIAEAETRRKAEEEARRKAAEEARLKAEAEAREKAEAENRRRIEEDTRKKVEAEFKARAEEEARKRQEEEAKRKDEEARKKAEEEQKRKIEDERRKAEEIRLAADSDKRKAEEARARLSQSAAVPVAAPVARPTSTEQVAAVAPPADPAAYVAQHWPALRQSATAYLRRRGDFNEPITNFVVRFNSLESHRVENVTANEITLALSYSLLTGSGTPSRVGLQNIRMRFRNQPPGFPVINASDDYLFPRLAKSAASSTPTPPSAPQQPQVAATPAPSAPADPAAYVAQHWNVMRPQVETALRSRGVVVDRISGIGMRFSEIFSYRLVSASADSIVLTVNYRNIRAVPGSGHATGNDADHTETVTFRNQPPAFPLVGMRSSGVSNPAPTQSAAAVAPDEFVRQNWPTLKSNAEAFMAKKGSLTSSQSGFALRYSSIDSSYKVVSVTPATITLNFIIYAFTSQGGGTTTYNATGVFQNQPPNFPVVRID